MQHQEQGKDFQNLFPLLLDIMGDHFLLVWIMELRIPKLVMKWWLKGKLQEGFILLVGHLEISELGAYGVMYFNVLLQCYDMPFTFLNRTIFLIETIQSICFSYTIYFFHESILP